MPERALDTASPASRVVLACEKLEIGYAGTPLLPPIDVDIRRRQFVLVVGRNGAGKSTLLKTVLGVIRPVRGSVRLAQPAPRIAYVPQAASLDDIVPVRGRTVAGWGRLRGWSFLRPWASRDDRRAREDALRAAEATEFAGNAFRALSGGQRQRILFARMLASDAELALLDEPTASMDMAAERDAYERLAAASRERDMTIVVVTHTIGVAAQYADRVLFVDRGERDGKGVFVWGEPDGVFGHRLFVRHFGKVSRDAG